MLACLAFFGLALLGAVGLIVGTLVKAIVWLVLLPLRLLAWLVALPFLLIGGVVTLVVGLAVRLMYVALVVGVALIGALVSLFKRPFPVLFIRPGGGSAEVREGGVAASPGAQLKVWAGVTASEQRRAERDVGGTASESIVGEARRGEAPGSRKFPRTVSEAVKTGMFQCRRRRLHRSEVPSSAAGVSRYLSRGDPRRRRAYGRRAPRPDASNALPGILVTNDDGVRAPGVLAVAQALQVGSGKMRRWSSPRRGSQSGKGDLDHHLTPVYVRTLTLNEGLRASSAAATPASQVKVALGALLKDKTWSVSGVDRRLQTSGPVSFTFM